jgi:hypothetical protein
MVKTGWRGAGVLALAAMVASSGTLAAQKADKQKPHQIRQTDANRPHPLVQKQSPEKHYSRK